MISALYKPLGTSTHQLAQRWGELQQQPTTHTGTLDPMADGVVIVLSGLDRFNKTALSNWQKTYQFEIWWGVQTDSLDLLGLTTKIAKFDLNQFPSTGLDTDQLQDQLAMVLPKFLGPQPQTLPHFAAKRMAGQSYFDLAKRGEKFQPAVEEVVIHQLQLLANFSLAKNQLHQIIQQRLSLVEGDFRQTEILANWANQIPQLPPQLFVSRLIATTSKRTYIRALVRDLALAVGLPATTFALTRTQNGPYGIQDCLCLI